MLLGNRKKQGEEQNWCIVLNPLRNEIDKKRVARAISDVFSLSTEEAVDLVSNTPIILLDNLTRNIAAKVKEYFRSAGAEIVLTNDIFYKRKCYRTVWPDPPNLSFLQKISDEKPAGETDHALPAAEALQEIRSLQSGVPAVSHEPEVSSWNAAKENTLRVLRDEVEKWRKECLNRRAEVERLQGILSRSPKESPVQAGPKAEQQGAVHEREKRIKELTAAVAGAEERYESLKEEYRQARQIFEEKMAVFARDKDEPAARNRTLEEKLRAVSEKNEMLEKGLNAANAELQKLQGMRSQESSQLESRLAQTLAEIEKLRQENRSHQEAASRALQSQELLARKLQEKEVIEEGLKDASALKESSEKMRLELEDKVRRLEEALAEGKKQFESFSVEAREKRDLEHLRFEEAQKDASVWKDRALELEKKLQQVEEGKKSLSHAMENYRVGQEESRGQYEGLLAKHQALAAENDKARLLALKSEETVKVLEAGRKELSAQLEIKSQKVRDLESKLGDADKELAGLRQNAAHLERLLQQRTVAVREKEVALENQIREVQSLKAQMEEREKSFVGIQAVSVSLEEQLKQFRSVNEQQEKMLLENRLQIEASSEQLRTAQRQMEELRKQIAEKESLVGEAQARCEKTEKALAESFESREKQERIFQEKMRQFEAKDREVENLRKQLRDINSQIEQRDLIQRRTQLTGQLSEKEDQLKRLVDQQNRVEVEIRQREETMRQILALQETLEKEIVEVKQSQRHLLELAKKNNKPANGHGVSRAEPSAAQVSESVNAKEAGNHD